MKKSYLSGAALALVLSAGSAMGADLPSRKGPPMYVPPPPPLWTGIYVGLNAGYAFSGSDSVSTAASPFFQLIQLTNFTGASAASATSNINVPAEGFIGGGQIGYNYQWGNSIVIGLEADIQGSGIKKQASAGGGALQVPFIPGFEGGSVASTTTINRSVDWLGTVRGRIGWLWTPTLLTYATGGLAYGGVSSYTNISTTFSPAPLVGIGSVIGALLSSPGSAGSYSDNRIGWTVGGGLEWMFMPNWSAKAEYLYYDLGSVTYGSSPLNVNLLNILTVGSSAVQTRAQYNGHIARVGLNYHFNWGAPVVASY